MYVLDVHFMIFAPNEYIVKLSLALIPSFTRCATPFDSGLQRGRQTLLVELELYEFISLCLPTRICASTFARDTSTARQCTIYYRAITQSFTEFALHRIQPLAFWVLEFQLF